MADLAKFIEQKINSNNQLQKFVQEARAVANVVFPETLPFSDKYCKLGAEMITVDANNDKHVYPNESGGFCLHLSKLNEIAKAAKIRTVDSRILERKVDERGNVIFISHQVTVSYRTITGEMIRESYTGKYDYFNDLASKKEGQVKSRRKHAEALAESNALTRAFNKVLPQLPQSFSKTDFSKPFLVPYVIDDKEALLADLPKEDQATLKKELARQRLNLTDTIYNAPPKQQVEDATYSVLPDEKTSQKPSHDAEEDRRAKNKIIAGEFKDAPQSERTDKILNLIKIKGWKHPEKPTVVITAAIIERATVEQQIARIEELLNMQEPTLEPEVSL
jgi:hypothetical protein